MTKISSTRYVSRLMASCLKFLLWMKKSVEFFGIFFCCKWHEVPAATELKTHLFYFKCLCAVLDTIRQESSINVNLYYITTRFQQTPSKPSRSIQEATCCFSLWILCFVCFSHLPLRGDLQWNAGEKKLTGGANWQPKVTPATWSAGVPPVRKWGQGDMGSLPIFKSTEQGCSA